MLELKRVKKMEISFGEKIRQLREDMDITQTQFGKKVNMTQRKVSYMENGTYEPSISDIKEICLFFNVSADYLLGLPQNLNYLVR